MAPERQTLMDTSIRIVDGQTIMKFTKLLREEGELEIFRRWENNVLYARGWDTEFPSYHAQRVAFHLSFNNTEGEYLEVFE